MTDSVKSIGGGAFYGCSSLTSITIPGVNRIGSSVFSDCKSLRSVYWGSGDWSYMVDMGFFKDSISSAKKYYYSKTKPTSSGNYWYHDENNEPKVW